MAGEDTASEDVKAGLRVAVVGDVEKEFATELQQSKAKIVADGAAGTAEAVFLFVERNGDAGKILKAAREIKGATGLWVVYAKGKKEITEGDVLGAGRKAGWKDVKVVGFSATHTALKFVVPVKKR